MMVWKLGLIMGSRCVLHCLSLCACVRRARAQGTVLEPTILSLRRRRLCNPSALPSRRKPPTNKVLQYLVYGLFTDGEPDDPGIWDYRYMTFNEIVEHEHVEADIDKAIEAWRSCERQMRVAATAEPEVATDRESADGDES